MGNSLFADTLFNMWCAYSPSTLNIKFCLAETEHGKNILAHHCNQVWWVNLPSGLIFHPGTYARGKLFMVSQGIIYTCNF